MRRFAQTPSETLANTQVSSNDPIHKPEYSDLRRNSPRSTLPICRMRRARVHPRSLLMRQQRASAPAKTPTPSASATAVPTNTATAVPTAPEPAETPSYDESEVRPGPTASAYPSTRTYSNSGKDSPLKVQKKGSLCWIREPFSVWRWSEPLRLKFIAQPTHRNHIAR